MSKKQGNCDEGVGPRFKRGADDLDQLTGIEKKQRRSRNARKASTEAVEKPVLIERIEKSRRRVKNRLGRIKDLGEANEQFGA